MSFEIWILILVIILAILIHEVCHILAAVFVGKKPKILSIGFWKPYLSFTYKGIQFRMTPFLLGGYVSFSENLMESKEELKKLSYSKQIIIYIGGCLGNLITGGIALLIIYFINLPLILTITFIYFGFMSLALGIGNLFPFPPLDGWQVFQCGIEKIIKRPFSNKTNIILTNSGFIILNLSIIICSLCLFIIN